MQNDLPLSAALRVSVRPGGDVGVAVPQAAAAGGPVEGAGLPDPLAAVPVRPPQAVRADTPITAAATNQTLRISTPKRATMSVPMCP
jgi:hypothetical protein